MDRVPTAASGGGGGGGMEGGSRTVAKLTAAVGSEYLQSLLLRPNKPSSECWRRAVVVPNNSLAQFQITVIRAATKTSNNIIIT